MNRRNLLKSLLLAPLAPLVGKIGASETPLTHRGPVAISRQGGKAGSSEVWCQDCTVYVTGVGLNQMTGCFRNCTFRITGWDGIRFAKARPITYENCQFICVDGPEYASVGLASNGEVDFGLGVPA